MKISDMAFLLGPVVIGMVSGRLLVPRRYKQCGRLPPFQPPGWVFAVAWTILYILCGVSLMMAWRKNKRKLSGGLLTLLYVIILLMIWWVVFATWCLPKTAFVTLVSLLGLVCAAIMMLWKEKKTTSASLIIPLAAWLFFASALSYYSIRR